MLKLEISIEDANIILGALSKQPYEVVSVLINSIHSQAKEQLEGPKEQSKEKKDKK